MKRLFRNTVFSGVETVTLVALNLVATPVLLKHLGTANYGVFVFLSIFSTYGLLSFFDLGMSGSLLNYVARFEAVDDREKIQNSLTVSVLFYGLIGALLGLTLYLCSGLIIARFTDETGLLDRVVAERACQYVAINVLFQFLTLPATGVLQGLRRYALTKSTSTILMILQYLLVITVTVLWKRIDYGFLAIALVSLLRLVVLTVLLWYRTSYFRSMRFRLDLDLLRELFSYSTILLVSRIIGLVFNQSGKFFIWLFLAASSMSVYDVMLRPANLVRMLITTLNSALVPEVARLHERGETHKIRILYVRIVRYCYLVTLPPVVVLAVHMHGILDLWVGAEMAQHYQLGLIALAVYLLAPVASVASTMAVGLQIVKRVIWISIVAAIINLALSFALLHVIELTGLMLAVVAAEMFMIYPYYRAMARLTDMRMEHLLKPLAGIFAVAAGFAVLNLAIDPFVSGHALVAVVMISMAVHVLINFRFLLTANEREFIFARLRRNGAAEAETVDKI